MIENYLSKRLTIIIVFIIQILLLILFVVNYSDTLANNSLQSCGYKSISGYNCSSCGNTRSVASFFKGNIFKSYTYNYVGFFISLFISVDIFLGIVSFFLVPAVKIRIRFIFISIVLIVAISSFRWFHLNYF